MEKEEESPESILSSSIVLDESLFHKKIKRLSFSSEPIKVDGRLADLANKTFRTYEESNQRIDTFTLRLVTKTYSRFGLATKWTLNALKLGATDLTFRCNSPSIAIPLTVVFANENVVRLCLESSRIDQLKVTKCPGIKSLTLSDVTIKPDPLFDIITCCPMIENLSLSVIRDKPLPKPIIMGSGIDSSSNNKPSDANDHDNDDEQQQQQEQVVGAAPPPALSLHKLTSLVLLRISSQFQIETLFLGNLSSKFPSLKHLTLGVKESLDPTVEVIQIISSASLETLNIMDKDVNRVKQDRWGIPQVEPERNRVPRVELDVPSIRKFTFEGKYIPNVSFRSISGYQWESHVSIIHRNGLVSTAWFRELSNFLTNLRGSKIHLCLHLYSYYSFDYDMTELDGLNVCDVEDLTMDIKYLSSLSCHALLDGLFRICRPKLITQYARSPDDNKKVDVYHWLTDGDRNRADTRNNDLFICRALERAMQAKSSLISTQFMYGLRDLEELNAQQLFDQVWKSQPLSSILLDDSTSDEKRRFRLQLKWKPSSCLKRPSDEDDDDTKTFIKRFKSVF